MPQRGIDTGLWSNLDFADISIQGKLLFIYLCTTFRGNQAGMFKISPKQISFDTGLSQEEVLNLFDELKPMDIEYYPDKQIVWVKQFLKHQAHSPKFFIAVAKNLEDIHYPDLIKQYLKHNHTLSIPYEYRIDNVSMSESESESESESGGIDTPLWCQILLDFKTFKIDNGWIPDIENRFSDINLEEAAKEFVYYWSDRKKDIKSMKATFLNRLKMCREKRLCLKDKNPEEQPYTGR